MHFYLAPYVGAGSALDPFRSRGSEQLGWSAIDLRPNGAVVTGRALMAVPVRDDTIGIYLGDAPDDVSLAAKLLIESSFGLVLQATRPRQMIAELLMVHGREDGTRWRNLRPSRVRNRYEIHLAGELWWSQLVIAGGVTISESFNKADNGLGPDLTWTVVTGTWGITSNTGRQRTTGQVPKFVRAESALASDNHAADALVTATGSQGLSGAGVLCRQAGDATETFYEAHLRSSPDKLIRLHKVIAAAYTTLGDAAVSTVGAHTIKVQADGSTIKSFYDGVEKTSVTDTGIAAGKYTGLWNFIAQAGADTFDTFTAADLATATTFVGWVQTHGGWF